MTPVTPTPGVGTTLIQLSCRSSLRLVLVLCSLVENCKQRKRNFTENLNSSSNVDIFPSSPPHCPLPPRWAFRRAAANRPTEASRGRGRSPARHPQPTPRRTQRPPRPLARPTDREKRRRRRTLREVKRRRKCHSEHTISPREGGFLGIRKV